jgi:hypothetical protein
MLQGISGTSEMTSHLETSTAHYNELNCSMECVKQSLISVSALKMGVEKPNKLLL